MLLSQVPTLYKQMVNNYFFNFKNEQIKNDMVI